MTSIDQALEQLLTFINPGVEVRSDLWSDRDYPPCDKSAMDGYAINTAHTEGARKIIGTIFTGEDPYRYALKHDECMKITTGACIPSGADAVVPIEECHLQQDSLVVTRVVKSGEFIRKKASHAKKGDLLLPRHHPMNTPRFALHAQIGQVPYSKIPPKIVICSTGDELSAQPSEFQIRDSNWHSLSYLLNRLGHECHQGPVLKDNPYQIAQFLNTESFDILVTTGGVSAGDKDYLPSVLKDIGARIIFHKLNIKPGMPMLAATVNKKIILGLPGNPVSTYVTSLLFLPPLLSYLMGVDPITNWTEGILENSIDHTGNKEWIIPAKLVNGFLKPLKRLDSSDLIALAQADVLLRINSPKNKGDAVPYQRII
jgi:molybdopterin molybdotransferase